MDIKIRITEEQYNLIRNLPRGKLNAVLETGAEDVPKGAKPWRFLTIETKDKS